MAQEVLHVENLNVNLAGQHVLKNVTFSVKQREVFIILGPNGAGKSVLFKTILGLLSYQGSVIWNTDRISYLPPQETLQRKDFPPLTIEDFFSFKGATRGQTEKILTDVGLDSSLISRQFHALSTGQFQRMAIAWALVNKPSVLLLDEPTSGVDVAGEETIFSLLHRFWKEWGLTIMLVTHDLSVVWEHADTVFCLNKEVVCQGSPQEVLTPEELKKLYGNNIKFYQHNHGNV